MSPADVVCDPAGLTSEWVSAALGRKVAVVSVVPVGTGQIGACYRVLLEDGSSLLAKLPAADPDVREMLAGAYRGEVTFYSELARTVAITVPECHHVAMRPGSGDFTLLLEDLTPAAQGDQIDGCSVAQARAAVVNLAGLHGPRWCDPDLTEIDHLKLNDDADAAALAELYGPATETLIDGLGALVASEDAVTLRACVDVARPWALARSHRFALVHGDYRLDNLMFAAGVGAGDEVAVWALDWQTLSLALPARDLAYFLGTSLTVEDRRECERDLVAAYHEALAVHGVSGYVVAECWDDYCFALLQGPLVAAFGFAYGTRTERGDQMFAAMVRRACAAIRDHDTIGRAARG